MFEMQTPDIHFKKIEKKGVRRLRLHVNRQGEVIVTVPVHTPQLLINRFINQQREWILRQQAALPREKVLPDDQIWIFGKTYQLVVTYEPSQCSGCSISDDQLLINTLAPDLILSHEKVQKTLERFLRTSASHYILQRTAYWAEKMQINYAKIQFRQQRSRWGSCSSTGTLNFNWRLVHAPPAVIDYVIIHELAHRKEMNHSPRFWQLVARFDPAYQRHRGWLKREGRWVVPEAAEQGEAY